MIHIRNQQDQRFYDWVRHVFREQLNMNVDFDAEKCVTKAIDKDGEELLAVVVFHDMLEGVRMEMSIASLSPEWCKRRVLFDCFDFCFNICGVQRIYTQVMGSNEKALELNKRLGFQLNTVLPGFQQDIDGNILDNHVFTMTKDECRWIK